MIICFCLVQFKRGKLQKINYWKKYILFIFFCIFVSSCSTPQAKLNRSIFPEKYQIPVNSSKTVSVIRISKTTRSLLEFEQFWDKGAYQQLYQSEHPIQKIRPQEMRDFLYRFQSLIIPYYVKNLSSVAVAKRKFFLKKICANPVNNWELQFLLSYPQAMNFQRKYLTLLMILSHELLLQQGATAKYPKVVSSLLRKKLNLSPRQTIEGMNLLSSSKKIFYEGFLFCRKN
ncbi:MAG: hypothetical protein ACI86H_000495 [bacterium]|jgi:hypothetical protein